MLAAFIFRTVRSGSMTHGCGYYLSSVTPVAILRSEVTNLGLNLASAQWTLQGWFLLMVEVSYTTTDKLLRSTGLIENSSMMNHPVSHFLL